MDYYIIYLGDGLPTFNEVRLNLENQLNQNLKCQNIDTEINVTLDSHDNFVGGVSPLDLDSVFMWRSPETEELWVNTYDSNGNFVDSISIDCDHLSYHMYVEEVVQDNIGMLNSKQINYIENPGSFFWRIRTREVIESKSLPAIILRNLIFIITKLSKGILFSFEPEWHLKILPMTADSFFQQYVK